MLNKTQLTKITKNYTNNYLDKSAKNIEKQIEALKDEKAITLILNAIQSIVIYLDNYEGKEVYYTLSQNRINLLTGYKILTLSLDIDGNDYFENLEDLDEKAVCINYLSKNKDNIAKNMTIIAGNKDYEIVTINESFTVHCANEVNFLTLGNKLLGKELTKKLLESIINAKYHV